MELSKKLEALMARVQNLPASITELEGQYLAVEERMAALKKAGLIYASGHWRAGKYFMLVYPQKDGERPSPKYIGTDEAKILEAQQGIERAKEYDQLTEISQRLAGKVRDAQDALRDLERILTIR